MKETVIALLIDALTFGVIGVAIIEVKEGRAGMGIALLLLLGFCWVLLFAIADIYRGLRKERHGKADR